MSLSLCLSVSLLGSLCLCPGVSLPDSLSLALCPGVSLPDSLSPCVQVSFSLTLSLCPSVPLPDSVSLCLGVPLPDSAPCVYQSESSVAQEPAAVAVEEPGAEEVTL